MLAISGSSLYHGFIIERFMRLYYAEIVHDHMGRGGGGEFFIIRNISALLRNKRHVEARMTTSLKGYNETSLICLRYPVPSPSVVVGIRTNLQ